MNETETRIYRELQEHLDKLPVGFPATKSGVELRLLEYLFTLEEAKVALKLSFKYEPLSTIYDRLDDPKITIEELNVLLDKSVKKGAIHYKREGNEKLYANAMLVIGIFEYQVNRLTREFMDLLSEYEEYDVEMFRTKISQTRIVPVEKSINHENTVATYNDIRELIKNAEGPIGVAFCVCREKQNVRSDRDPCKLIDGNLETCLGWGTMGRLYVDQGWGREVSKEEALKILDRNEKIGLIPQPGNAQKPEFICNCCGCCCGILRALKKMNNPARLMKTNFFAEVDADLCSGCEVCVDRCQMDAIIIVDNISTINKKKCLGCGLCVVTCPSEAISLKNKEKVVEPPEIPKDLYDMILSKKNELIKKYEK